MLGAVSLTFFIWLIIFSVQVLYAVDGGEHCGDKKQIGHLAGFEGSREKRVVRGRVEERIVSNRKFYRAEAGRHSRE